MIQGNFTHLVRCIINFTESQNLRDENNLKVISLSAKEITISILKYQLHNAIAFIES